MSGAESDLMTNLSKRIESVLGQQGIFQRTIADFKCREAQLQMAEKVAETIEYKGCLLAESGTGTGKTFAYLVPAILSGKKTIISTATKHLQEQIYFKDLPVVTDALDSSISCSMLKGRSNYLCLHHYKQHSSQKQNRTIEVTLQNMRDWTRTTKTGDLAEFDGIDDNSPVPRLVTSTVDNCLGGKCADFDKCFVNKARQQALKADIVVVNHHLFFSDLTLKVDGFGELLPYSETIIFDEAHKVPEIATQFFGQTISSFQLYDLLNDILRFAASEKKAMHLPLLCQQIQAAAQSLAKAMAKSKHGVLDNQAIDRLNLTPELQQLDELLSRMQVALEAFDNEDLQQCLQRLNHVMARLQNWAQPDNSDLVKWAEVGEDFFRLHLTPVSIREQTRQMMSTRGQSFVFTSATLAVAQDFSAFKNELGIDEVDSFCWESPFNFADKTLLYLPPGMCDPRDEQYVNRLLDVILQVTSLSKGRAFCLFTSYAVMNKVYEQLKHLSRYPLLLQGSRPKRRLLDDFKTTKNAILLGTSSFWEGVDVKGEALSCVIVDKIPFTSPSDPVYRRKLEADEKQGKNPFMHRQVPDAVITLKQGAGRLMRSEDDSGVLVLCDPRIVSSRYGSVFLQSLPPMPRSNRLDDIQRFFAK